MLPVRVHVFTCRILNQEFIILFDVVGDCQDSKARYSFQSSFSSLNICHQRILIIVITQAFTFGEILSSLIIPTPLVLIILWTFMTVQDYLLKFRKISSL